MNYEKGKPVMFEVTEINKDGMTLTFSDKKFIIISEEDFDNALKTLFEDYRFDPEDFIFNKLKEELFKDLK